MRTNRHSVRRFLTPGLTIAVLALPLALISPASAVAADIDADLRVGAYTDAEEAFIGAGLLTRIGGDWFFNPNLEWVFVDRGDLATLNADFHYDLAHRGDTDFWLGAGPALVMREGPGGNDETDVGLNLLAGIGFLRSQPLRPYLQAKVLISDNTEGVIAFGVRFP